MPPGDKKSSQHLMTCLVILIILLMAALTALILMKSGDNSPNLSQAKPWYLALNTKASRFVPSTTSTSTKTPTTVTTKQPREVCTTPECITLAHQLHNFQDISVDPCQDFYKAACGKYNEHNLAVDTGFRKRSKIAQELVKEFLFKNQSSTSKSENVMHLLYGKCEEMKKDEVNEAAKWNDAFEVIQRVGSWPIFDSNWNETEFDLNDMLIRMANHGFYNLGIYTVNSVTDGKLLIWPSMNVLENYETGEIKKAVQEILKNNSIETDEKLVDEDFENVEELLKKRIQLLENVTSPDFIDFATYQKRIPSVDFERVIKSFIRSSNKNGTWNKIKDRIFAVQFKDSQNEVIDEKFESILTKTPKRTLANYLLFHVVETILRMNKFSEKCEDSVIQLLPIPSLRVFVRNHFKKENLNAASDVLNEMRETFIEIIQESKWLHKNTKKKAIQKVEMMKQIIGYPRELDEAGALDRKFEALEISPIDSYFTIIAKILRFTLEQTIEHVAGEFGLVSDFNFLDGDASYNPFSNLLQVHVPLLDAFDSTYPKYAIIPFVGGVVGHEIGHGFDPKGRQYNGTGQLEDWWTPEDSAEYDKRAQCLVDQYDNYDDPTFGRNLNGKTTIGEMIADIIGFDMAWRSYKKVDMSSEPAIIGFEDYNLDKLYFRLAALTWCSGRPTHTLEKQLKDVHATNSYRINGVFSNMKSFAKAYNCPVGSPMNPKKKCELF